MSVAKKPQIKKTKKKSPKTSDKKKSDKQIKKPAKRRCGNCYGFVKSANP